MKEMQFTSIVLSALMAMALITMLPQRVSRDRVLNHSRWMMAVSMLLFCAQYILQYTLDLRAKSTTQAVMVNLIFFIPISAHMSLGILNLERQGRLKSIERIVGIVTWIFAVVIIGVVVFLNKAQSAELSDRMQWAEITVSCAWGLMQIFYAYAILKELGRMELALADYYDHDRGGLLRWLRITVGTMATIALFAPLLIYSPKWALAIYGTFTIIGIFYIWFCFIRYVITSASKKVKEAELNLSSLSTEADGTNPEVATPMSEENMQHIKRAVERWLQKGSYLKAGITSPVAATEMKIPRYQLSTWLKVAEHTSFSRWITKLRIEKAKSLMSENPEYSIDVLADQCGISRSYFFCVFKKETGMAPLDYINKMKRNRN